MRFFPGMQDNVVVVISCLTFVLLSFHESHRPSYLVVNRPFGVGLQPTSTSSCSGSLFEGTPYAGNVSLISSWSASSWLNCSSSCPGGCCGRLVTHLMSSRRHLSHWSSPGRTTSHANRARENQDGIHLSIWLHHLLAVCSIIYCTKRI